MKIHFLKTLKQSKYTHGGSVVFEDVSAYSIIVLCVNFNKRKKNKYKNTPKPQNYCFI